MLLEDRLPHLSFIGVGPLWDTLTLGQCVEQLKQDLTMRAAPSSTEGDLNNCLSTRLPGPLSG